MIQQWYEPLNFSEWLKRVFSLLNIAVFLITATIIFSEFRYNWFENIVGSYLSSTNEFRPEKGAIWEAGKQTSNAHEYLNKIISKKEDTLQNVHQSSTFSSLAAGILPGEWVTLDTKQFKKLYLTLDKSTALEIIEPAKLVWLLSGSSLNRIFCEGIKGGIKIYFIDSENRVIKQIDLRKEEIIQIENGGKPISGRLTDMEGFSGRVYSAKFFFDALFKLPADIIPDLIANPEILLEQDGKIVNIGIWNEAENGYIKIGFEFDSPESNQIVFIKGREWAVWQLSLNLKGEAN
jgi:hypothetical protein